MAQAQWFGIVRLIKSGSNFDLKMAFGHVHVACLLVRNMTYAGLSTMLRTEMIVYICSRMTEVD